jgi:hypothetical protein
VIGLVRACDFTRFGLDRKHARLGTMLLFCSLPVGPIFGDNEMVENREARARVCRFPLSKIRLLYLNL